MSPTPAVRFARLYGQRAMPNPLRGVGSYALEHRNRAGLTWATGASRCISTSFRPILSSDLQAWRGGKWPIFCAW